MQDFKTGFLHSHLETPRINAVALRQFDLCCVLYGVLRTILYSTVDAKWLVQPGFTTKSHQQPLKSSGV